MSLQLIRGAVLAGLRQNGSAARAALGAVRHFSAAAEDPDKDPGEDPVAVERFRAAKNFRRRADGRVFLKSPAGEGWMETKLDGYVEGSLLLLDPEGLVYYLVSEDLKQIDLSNDQLVAQLFADGSWDGIKMPLYTQVTDVGLQHVRMTPQQFRSIFTVLRQAPGQGGPTGMAQ
ncbi:hypothetical protein HYH03_013749 [Edaphochlamys debaryana]|uniref:Uncharacterized protein n=1 Tax=Edaphochlamys debaryana TaxID=47281 RepID=A0A835XVH6_9CHLO|nr:hypothetical protein HYH03_013749 [Edaphochlamys debaryana]|eukprot:KAG2487610.1 hypothetical protein HYH03_013749 [Edaphochlamys debaryana]